MSSNTAILKQFDTESLTEFEQALDVLLVSFRQKFYGSANPLGDILGIEIGGFMKTSIPILDEHLRKHVAVLSDKYLIDILGMTLTSADFYQFETTEIILEELAHRKNEQTQQEAVQILLRSCESYTGGIVFFANLLSNYVSQFESAALYDLLLRMPRHLMTQGTGDDADLLFVPAFENTADEALQNQLIAVFFSYKEDTVYYNGEAYFDTLLTTIKANLSPHLQAKLDAEDLKRKAAALVRPSEAEMVQLINIINQEDNTSESYYDIVYSQIEAIDLNDHVVAHTLDYFIESDVYDRHIGAHIFNLWAEKSPAKAGIYVTELINSEKRDHPIGNTMIHDFYNLLSGQLPFFM